MSSFLKYKLHHVLFWIFYFVFWTYFSVHNYGGHVPKALLATFIYFIGQAGIGYFSIYYLLPYFFFKKRYILFVGLVFIGIMLGGLFITAGMYALFPSIIGEGANHISIANYFLYSFLAVLSSTILFISVSIIKEDRKSVV